MDAPVPGGEKGCCVCGEARSVLVTEGQDYEYGSLDGRRFRVVRCCGCGHVYVDPLPAPGELSAIYPETYYTVNPRSPLFLRGFIYAHKLERDVKRLLSQLEPERVRSVVDLGCGDGQRLAKLAARLPAAECIGVDLQPDRERAAELARSGIRLEQGDIEEGLEVLRDGGHDVVVMSQIIEHLRWPPRALANVARKLAPRGRLVIETPNVGGFDERLFRRRYWGAYHLPRHFHLFRPDSMERLLGNAGLRVVRKGFLPSPGFWITSFRNALGLRSDAWSGRFGEFLNYGNLPVVGAFTALDLACIAVGLPTSTQFLVAEKP